MSEFWTAFTREQTDEQYNPTLWTPRQTTNDLLASHVEITSGKSDKYRTKMHAQMETIKFGEGEFAGSMDVFRPTGATKEAPVIVYIHGGWWQWFAKEQFSFLAEPFNSRGMTVYMPAYRMAQDWNNGSPMESIQTQMEYAVAAILNQAAKQGSSAVYLVGHSAGGHLVTLLREADWNAYGVPIDAQKKLKGVFSLAGLFDIRPLVNSFVNDEIKMSPASAAKVSPYLKEISDETRRCPLHLIVPEYDTPEFFRQTKEHQAKLLRAGQPCHFHLANNRDHLDIIENLVNEDDEVFAYVIRQIENDHPRHAFHQAG